jgi:hypothetical protein
LIHEEEIIIAELAPGLGEELWVELRSNIFTRGRLAIVAIMLGIRGEVYETW